MNKFKWGMRAWGIFLLWAATAIALPAQTFTTVHSFDNADGTYPTAGLVQATNGDFYGTTYDGGANKEGTVFKITLRGKLTTLHEFDGLDGSEPLAGLVEGTDGNFYGTTEYGGANQEGTVFRISPNGTLISIYSFCSQANCTDGASPYFTRLIQAANGDFYGTTEYGGANGDGTVFRITPSGTLTTLHSFDRQDGYEPIAGLVQGTDGNFYGTTSNGGRGFGAIFQIALSGALKTLHIFDRTDGSDPAGALVQGTDGNFYGTTFEGGSHGGCRNRCGTIFKITRSGLLTTLHSFDSTDGRNPFAGLVRATDGNFYGTTIGGGTNDGGTVFRITPNGRLRTLYNFCSQIRKGSCADGGTPYAGLPQDTNGDFYGTTEGGGANNAGTVFSLSVGLGPFVETNRTSGKVGVAVKILGTNLTGATSVTFNGTPATFTVKSKSEIATTVPTGATTGPVQVVTPSGTLSSNLPFRVTP
jgi:uncharacterized repeat protein (TIGR03803 family)